MQQIPGVKNYSGRPDSYPTGEEPQYTASKAGQWQWERDAQQMSPQLYNDGQGGNVSRPMYPNQMPDTKVNSNQEQRVHPQEQDMEIGYEKSPTPHTLERLDEKFHHDIMKLIKEQDDAEDSEIVRHKEKILEINNQYQEKLSALRTRHSARREELLRRESEARLQKYNLANTNSYQNNTGPNDINRGHHGYGAPDSMPSEPRLQYGGEAQYNSFRERHESFGRGRIQGTPDTRVPTPGGRVYNTGPRYY